MRCSTKARWRVGGGGGLGFAHGLFGCNVFFLRKSPVQCLDVLKGPMLHRHAKGVAKYLAFFRPRLRFVRLQNTKHRHHAFLPCSQLLMQSILRHTARGYSYMTPRRCRILGKRNELGCCRNFPRNGNMSVNSRDLIPRKRASTAAVVLSYDARLHVQQNQTTCYTLRILVFIGRGCPENVAHQPVVLLLRTLRVLPRDHPQHPPRRRLGRVHTHHDQPHQACRVVKKSRQRYSKKNIKIHPKRNKNKSISRFDCLLLQEFIKNSGG